MQLCLMQSPDSLASLFGASKASQSQCLFVGLFHLPVLPLPWMPDECGRGGLYVAGVEVLQRAEGQELRGPWAGIARKNSGEA